MNCPTFFGGECGAYAIVDKLAKLCGSVLFVVERPFGRREHFVTRHLVDCLERPSSVVQVGFRDLAKAEGW